MRLLTSAIVSAMSLGISVCAYSEEEIWSHQGPFDSGLGANIAVCPNPIPNRPPILIIGAPDDQGGKGTVTVIEAGAAAPMWTEVGASTNDRLGSYVACGDFLVDGTEDIIIGAKNFVRFYDGVSPNLVMQHSIRAKAVRCLEDRNGDSLAEFAVVGFYCCRVSFHHGFTGQWFLRSPEATTLTHLEVLGDVYPRSQPDGFLDVVTAGTGYLALISGSDGSEVETNVNLGALNSMAVVGDIYGSAGAPDGIRDIVFDQFLVDGGDLTKPAVHGFPGIVDQRLSQVASAGDVDNDGVEDLVFVHDSFHKIFSGNQAVAFPQLDETNSSYASAVALGQDVNEDGYLDYAVGDPSTNTVKTLAGDDLWLYATPDSASPGDQVSIVCGLGKFLQPAMILIREIDGVPVNGPKFMGRFGPTRQFILSGQIPTAMPSGIRITLQAFGLGDSCTVEATDLISLEIQ